MTIKEMRAEIDKVMEAVVDAAEKTGYNDFEYLDCIYNEEDPNEIQELHELQVFLDDVITATERILYLREPITHEGILRYTPRGKLSIITGNEEEIELDGGQWIEILQYDFINKRDEWRLTRTSRATAGNYSIVGNGIAIGEMTQARIRY